MADQTVTVAGVSRTPSVGTVEVVQPGPQSITVLGVRRSPVVGGPRIRQGGVTPAPIEVKLYEPDFSTFKADLPETWGRQFQEQINEPGSGRFEIDNWIAEDGEMVVNPLAELIEIDDVVRFYVHGECAFAMVVNETETQSLSGDEEIGETTRVSGIGVLSSLSDALVYPARGLGVRPIDENRLFNWTSNDFDDSGWTEPTSLMSVSSAQTNWQVLPFAEDFPYGSAQVVWDRSTADILAPVGVGFFRHDFESSGNYFIYAVADGAGILYSDSSELAYIDGFHQVTTAFVESTPGWHTLAIQAQNIGFPEDPTYGGPAGIAYVVYNTNEAGDPEGGPICVSGGLGAKSLIYPPRPPGMTPGEVIIHCGDEGKARGCFPSLSYAFDANVDSNGTPWDEYGDIATKVGTDLLTFLGELSDTYIDFWMEPSRLRLWAWRKGERGRTVTAAPTSGSSNSSLVNLSHGVHR